MMKAARERLGLSLAVSTGTTSDPNAIRVEHQKKIQATTEEDVARRYKLGGMVGVMMHPKVMYKLLTGRFPSREEIFDDKPGENWRLVQFAKPRINFTRPPLDRSPEAAELCAKMLSFDPMDRPSAEEALKHAWFLVKSNALPTRPRR
eukprot:g22882.t1